MTDFGIILFSHGEVGLKTTEFILDHHPSHLRLLVVVDQDSPIYQAASQRGFEKSRIILNSDLEDAQTISRMKSLEADFCILAWWPNIIKRPILELSKKGMLNFHPSLLPYNRGKHYNFWTLVEKTPFGVSLHFVSESIDEGDIVFQKEIPKSWEDTGETLYKKAQTAMFELFRDNYLKIVSGNFERRPQDLARGSFHYGRELEAASEIDINKEYKARDLLDLIRARTFDPFPACYFTDGDETFEVRVNIKRRRNS